MARAYVYMEESENPPPPLGLRPLTLPFGAFCRFFLGWHHEVINEIFDSTDERYSIRHLTGQMRSVIVQRNFFPVAYTVHIRFVR